MSLAGSLLFALADGHGDAVFAEDGGDLQVSAERFDVGAQGGKVDLAAALQPGDAARRLVSVGRAPLAQPVLVGQSPLVDLDVFCQAAQQRFF